MKRLTQNFSANVKQTQTVRVTQVMWLLNEMWDMNAGEVRNEDCEDIEDKQ